MREMMKRDNFNKKILNVMMFCILLTIIGCKDMDTRKDSSVSVAELETEKPAPDEFEYEFEPHVISEEYRTIYGEGIEEEFYAFCDAILMKENTFTCRSKERFHQLLAISNSCFPLAQELIDKDETTVENGICHLTYHYDEEKTEEIILSFRNKVSDVIRTAIPYEEPDSIKAMELFTAVTEKDTYDESYTLDDSLKIRSYRSIMNDIGI